MLSIGRQGQLYVIKEVTYGVTPALAVTNALRHTNVTFPSDNKNRRTILEKKQSPWTIPAARTDQRKTASHNLSALLRPSGTINTLPECDPILEAAFGSKTNVTLSTTVASGGTVSGATLTSAGTLAVGDAVLILCPDTKKRIRFLLTVAGAVVTWGPQLPAGQSPAIGAAVKGCLTYKLTSLLAISLSLAHYLKKTDGSAGMKRAISGAVIDKFSLMFDANDEPTFTASGPAKSLDDGLSQPGGFTMVGGQPPSGLTGDLMVGNTIIKFMKLGIDLTNAMFLRNEDYGDVAAVEAFRQGRPEISIGIDQRAETEADLYDLAEAGTNTGVFSQTGYTEGNCLAVRAPLVEFKIPDTDDPDDVVNYPFKGLALESADNVNDALFLALA